MSADLDLQQQISCPFDGPIADKIENSFITAWMPPRDTSILLGLAWAYRDCGFEYASKEASFLWELSGILDLGEAHVN